MILPSKIQQVVPLNDAGVHDESIHHRHGQLPVCRCVCQPEHQEISSKKDGVVDAMIVVHNAFDGRQGVEWTNEIIAQ